MSDDYNENEFFSTKAKPVQQRRPRPEMPNGPVPMQPAAAPVPPSFTMPQAEMPVFPPDPFMQQRAANPLANYFRVPGLNIRLPTGGAYLPPGAYEPLANGDVAILPMRAADEMLMKNPDALMSGQAIEEMIRSCVPAIKAPHLLSVPDLDVLLLGVRWASYGDKMEVEVNCPKCEHENTYDADLPTMLATVGDLPRECPVRLADDLIAYLRPYNLRNATKLAIAAFEESRRMVFLAEATDEQRMAAMSESYKRITALNAEMLTDCILYVATPGGNVTDRTHIFEFMANTDRRSTKKIDDALKELNSGGIDKGIDVTCAKCSHEWRTNLEFDPASFFGQSS